MNPFREKSLHDYTPAEDVAAKFQASQKELYKNLLGKINFLASCGVQEFQIHHMEDWGDWLRIQFDAYGKQHIPCRCNVDWLSKRLKTDGFIVVKGKGYITTQYEMLIVKLYNEVEES